jgi:hypothetical protein
VRGTRRKKQDGVWEVRVYLGRDATTGSPRQLSRTVHGSARDADAVLHDLIAKHGGGSADGIRATFSQLLDSCLEECERLTGPHNLAHLPLADRQDHPVASGQTQGRQNQRPSP